MITFLKLGGSLITDKDSPHTPRPETIRRLAEEIYEVWNETHMPLILGHGSGSFGHVPAKHYGTRSGVHTPEEWKGFAEVHAEAADLNHLVTGILRDAGLPVISFVPMDTVRASDGNIAGWDTSCIMQSLSRGLIPLVFGDTVFDSVRGGTILSTEDLFLYLCRADPEPSRILLSGIEEGVWQDFPRSTKLVRQIFASTDPVEKFIGGSSSTDVTGGMYEKVRLMKELILAGQCKSAVIFSGDKPGNVKKALQGEAIGTAILPEMGL